MKLDQSGTVLWESIVPGLHSRRQYPPRGIESLLMPDESLLLAGFSEPDDFLEFDADLRAVLLNRNGELVWDYAPDKKKRSPQAIVPLDDGKTAIFCHEWQANNDGSMEPLLLTLDEAGNDVSSTLLSNIDDFLHIRDAVGPAEGTFYAGGISSVEFDNDSHLVPALLNVNLEGETQWLRKYLVDSGGTVEAVALRNDGLIALTGGWFEGVSGRDRAYVMTVDADGFIVWYQPDIVPPRTPNDLIKPYDLAVDHAGNIIVVGDEYGVDNIGGFPMLPVPQSSGFIAQVAPDGNVNWVRKVGGYFYGVCVGNDGTYYAVGGKGGDALVVHFDQSGNILN